MAVKRTFNGVTLLRTGAFSKTVVQNLSGFPLQPTGIVGIVGEAVGGEPRVLDILTKTQIQSAIERYGKGPIVDALSPLTSKAKDSRVPAGCGTVVVYKVNNSTQSTATLKNIADADFIDLTSKNYGLPENQLSLAVAAAADSNAKIDGTVSAPFLGVDIDGKTLILKVNGVTYTYTSGLAVDSTAGEMVDDLNDDAKWAPSRPITASVVSTDKVGITLTTPHNDFGYIYVDETSELDTVLGITGVDRGDSGARVVSCKKGSEELVSPNLGGVTGLNIKYVGVADTCKLSIVTEGELLKLKTTCLATAADDLDLDITELTTDQIVTMVDALAAYEATLVNSFNADRLDMHTDLNIELVAAALKKDTYDFVDWFVKYNPWISAAKKAGVNGMVAPIEYVELTGATAGTMTNSDWSDAFLEMKGMRINTVVPLISEDKGSVSVDSVNALCATHVNDASATDGKSERNAYVSKLGTKDEVKEAAKSLANGRVSVAAQDVYYWSETEGEEIWHDPWMYAILCASVQAGTDVGEPITYKLLNASDMRVRDASWNPKNDADEMIEAGVLVAEELDTGGWRTIVGNTSYGVDSSWVWNRISVIEAADSVAYDLRYNLEAVFTGTKAKTGTAENIGSFIKSRMEIYLKNDWIVGDDLNEGLGYKNLRINLSGATAEINISITPVQGIDWILPTIYLADIRQSA